METIQKEQDFRSGFISIIGKTNVGKSTLLNSILGEKIAIISEKPQTTRNKILGIKNTHRAQMIFLDTPGIHKARSQLNRYMVKEATRTYSEVDIVLLVIEADTPSGEKDNFVVETLNKIEIPILLAINKVDLVKKTALLPLMDEYKNLCNFEGIIPISALSGEGVNLLVEELENLLPTGPRYFPEEMITDLPERFIVAEMIREKIFNLTSQEIPYSVAVMVEEFKEREDTDTIYIRAVIHVEKPSQKGIVIGKKGRLLKDIGKAARGDIESLLGTKVYLELWVKVDKDWSKDIKAMRRLGYR